MPFGSCLHHKSLLLCLLLFSLATGFIFHNHRKSRKPTTTSNTHGFSKMAKLVAFLGLIWLLFFGFFGVDTSCQNLQAPMAHYADLNPHRERPSLPDNADAGQHLIPWIDDPERKDPQAECPGYIASDVVKTETGFTAALDLAGKACNVYGNDVLNLTLTVNYQGPDRLNIEIKPRFLGAENQTWFDLPEAMFPKPANPGPGEDEGDLKLDWENGDDGFAFEVSRRSTGDVLFSTVGRKLVYEDQFIEFKSLLPQEYNLYGLGEVIRGFRLGNNLTRTLYNVDAGGPVDKNLYGSHPVYLDTRYFARDINTGGLVYQPFSGPTDSEVSYESYTHGVFLRNSHAQEVLLRPEGITWRTLGGSIDLYIYAGPRAEDVISAYQMSTVGLPAMQQYWTLGFHQCRWGYENWTVIEDVVNNFEKFNIPLETIWADIDYMNQYRDFEHDLNTFPYDKGASFLDRLHKREQHFVPIVDSAIYSPNPENGSDAYHTYDRGVEADAFVLNPDGSLYVGAVWPGYTVFPDWVGAVLSNSSTFQWWAQEIKNYYQKVAFDGIWIDMSEAAAFCVGSCGSDNLTMNPVQPAFGLPGTPGNLVLTYPEGFEKTNASEASSASSVLATQTATQDDPSKTTTSSSTTYLRTTPTPGSRNINYPPYVINHVHGDLAVHGISPNTTHHGGTVEYDLHNLYGYQILNATYSALLSVFPGKRPFIIGRSTFAGAGKWAGHWGGDNGAEWHHLVFSIPHALSFSIFGFPMFGPDTCGFAGNTDLELCSRWMQLSAFFPFYRNHNVKGAISQEPYIWADVAEASRKAMAIRYSLLPYMYTLFARAHESGATVMRALSWEFPAEPWLADADHQFLLGPALLITPVTSQGATTVNGVFPGIDEGGSGTIWYDWYTKKRVTGVQRGENVTVEAPLGHIPLYVRGGYILPMQEPEMTTAASRRSPWELLVAMGADGLANGELYLDDGESLDPVEKGWVDLTASPGKVSARGTGNWKEISPLGNVTVLGVPSMPLLVSFNDQAIATTQWAYDSTAAVLRVTGLNDLTADGAWNKDWVLGWA